MPKVRLAPKGADDIVEAMLSSQNDPGLRRPYFNDNGIPCVTLKTGAMVKARREDGSLVLNAAGESIEEEEVEEVRIQDLPNELRLPVHNATSLRWQTWNRIDAMVEQERLARLRAFSDIASAVPMPSFDAFATPVLHWENQSDDGEALQDMDMVNEERNFSSVFQRESVPVPITHAGWFLSKRQLRQSEVAGAPLNLDRARMAIQKMFEKVEDTLIGTKVGISYSNDSGINHPSTVYGYLTYPGRATKTNMTAPTGSNGTTVLTDWLALRDLLYQNNYFGPIVAYTSTDWDPFLDNLFSTTEPSAGTLRSRLTQATGITSIRRLDRLTTTFKVIFVVMEPSVIQAIVGQQPVTVQWEEMGGFLLKYRTWCILSQRIKEDFSGRCGIAIGSTA